MYLHICAYASLSLSIYIYIYICIYTHTCKDISTNARRPAGRRWNDNGNATIDNMNDDDNINNDSANHTINDIDT